MGLGSLDLLIQTGLIPDFAPRWLSVYAQDQTVFFRRKQPRRPRVETNKIKGRRRIVELLEARQLLAGDWNDQRTELNAELGKLTEFAQHVESASSLSEPLDVFGRSFNGRVLPFAG